MPEQHPENQIANVSATDETLALTLRDGRTAGAPLLWFLKLNAAAQADREIRQISAGGYGIHWPRIDEDISVEGLLNRLQAPSP